MRYIIYRITVGAITHYGHTEHYGTKQSSHLFTLRGKRHSNKILQAAYNKNPTAKFDIVGRCKYLDQAITMVDKLIADRDNKSAFIEEIKL